MLPSTELKSLSKSTWKYWWEIYIMIVAQTTVGHSPVEKVEH